MSKRFLVQRYLSNRKGIYVFVDDTTGTFEEVQDLLPKSAFLILVFVLVATAAFILICHFIESIGTSLWMFAVTTVIFVWIIIFCWLVKLRVNIKDDVISIRFIRKYEIPFAEVIDYKVGDINIMRNYSGWGIKKVTFKNLICVGYDNGISMKLTGRRVFTISLSEPEKFASLLPAPQS